MKQIKNFAAVKLLLLVAVCATLFSFSGNVGGESFEIFLNGKLMIQQHLYQKPPVASLTLDPQSVQDEVKVHYNNCGHTDTGRTLTIRDEQNKILKEWQFADAATMTWKVKDISLLEKKSRLTLCYSSKELPKVRVLASLVLSKETQAALN